MAAPYLQHQPWSAWTRDERFFCSVLYSDAQANPAEFAAIVQRLSGVTLHGAQWDLGFEVCFYRDYLWQLKPRAASYEAFATSIGLPRTPSLKRTFDLCLFGESQLVVIEAKVCEGFTLSQNSEFADDRGMITSLPGFDAVDVVLIGLASQSYLDGRGPRDEPGDRQALKVFDGTMSWGALAREFSGETARLMQQADEMYGMLPGQFLGGPS